MTSAPPKRVSDALGTATEIRAMKNYAGHRLSPWLGHMMVSRSESARPLLTPGEIMQLPPSDEIVMIAGTPPIRAQKARYFEDTQLQDRVLTPPVLVANAEKRTADDDDWSALPSVPRGDDGKRMPDSINVDSNETGGLAYRWVPELDPEATREPERTDFNEFELDPPDEKNAQSARLRELNRNMRLVARQATLDPRDGIEL